MTVKRFCDICNEEIQPKVRRYTFKMQMIREAGEVENFESYSREINFDDVCKSCYNEINKRISVIGNFIEDIPEA